MTKHSAGPWSVGYASLEVLAPGKDGYNFKVCDIRGWGYFTGGGHGALGLSPGEAKAIQEANARLIAAAPKLLEALRAVVSVADRKTVEFDKAHAAIAEAEGNAGHST